MGKTEVSVAQWRKFINDTNYRTDAETNDKGAWVYNKEKWGYVNGKSWRDPNYSYEVKENFPVTCVSWNDADAFCKWLTKKERKAGRLCGWL